MMNHSSMFSRRVLLPLSKVCVLLILLGAVTAQGATYYVATTGSDSNPGTLTQPFKSFKKGVGLLQPGDTLYIRGGTWTERIDLQGPNKTGTANAWIMIAGYPGETVTIRYADTTVAGFGPIKARGNRGYFIFENLILDGINFADEVKWQIRDGNHHFILREIEMKNFPTSNLLVMGDDVTIQNCIFRDGTSSGEPGKRGYGIYYSRGSNGLIEKNDVYNQVGGGMQIYPGPINNLVIRNNKIHDNNTTVNSSIGGILVAASGNTVSDVRVYNNLIYNNGSSPLSGRSHGLKLMGGSVTGTKVWNNTIYKNKGYGLWMGQPVNTVVQNNIIFANINGPTTGAGTGTIFSHNLTTDPKFINPDASDFRLHARSEGIDGGVDIRQVTTDFRKTPRPQGAAYDIGAYESDDSDSQSPGAPKNVSIR